MRMAAEPARPYYASGRLKVVIVGPYPKPGEPLAGGTERVIDCLLGTLPKMIDLSLIVPGADIDLQDTRNGLKIYYLRKRSLPGFLRYWRQDARAVAHQIEAIGPDLVHVHSGSGSSRFITRPTIITVHGMLGRDIVEKNRGNIYRIAIARAIGLFVSTIEKRYRRRAKNAIVISPYMKEALPDLNNIKTFDIPNPVAPEFLISERPNNKNRERHLVAVQRIGPLKNTLGMVKAAVYALKQDTEARLTICGQVGDNSHYRACLEVVRGSGLEDRIVFAGHKTTDEIIHLLDSARCYITMSRQETAPMAVAEALCRGTAVLGPNNFGFPHMIEQGRNGFLWPQEDLKGQAALILSALNYEWDHDGIMQEAREKYGVEEIGERTYKAYREIAYS